MYLNPYRESLSSRYPLGVAREPLIRDSIKKSLVETRGYDAGGDDIAQFDADFSIMSAELAEFVEQLLGSMDS